MVCAAIAAGVWWWTSRGHAPDPATSTGSAARGSAMVVARPTGTAPAERASVHVTVTVRDAAGPLANAAVRIAGDELDDALVLRTGRDGSVRSPDLAAGAVRIAASADGHVPAGVSRDLAAGDDARVELVLATGGAVLSGIVSDMTGGPVVGARVDAAARGGFGAPPLAVASTLTGAGGRYRMTVAPAMLSVAVRSADYAPQARYVVLPATGATADFALVPGGVIEGIVRDRQNHEPVAGAKIEASHDGPAIALAESGRREVTAGSDGRFRVTGLRPGAYALRASADARTSERARLGLGVAEQVTGVELLVGTAAVVRGVVLDDTNKRVAGAEVSGFGMGQGGAQATSAADGTFALFGLGPAHWELMASGAGYVPAGTVQVALGARDVTGVEVRVGPGAKLIGHVEPRQPCEVRLELDDGALIGGMMPMLLAPTQTGSDGAFELGPASSGKATLQARCTGGDEGSLPIDLPSAPPGGGAARPGEAGAFAIPAAAELVVHVTPGGSIAGRVVDTAGQPVAGVSVAAAATTGAQHTVIVDGVVTSGAQAVTDASGSYELRGLEAGDYALSALDRGRPMMPRGKKPTRVTLAATEHKTGVELAIERADGTIEGTVTGPDGAPIADAWVSASQDLASLIAGTMGDEPDHADGPGSASSMSRTITVSDDGNGGSITGDFTPALTDASGHYKLAGLPHVALDIVAEAQGGKLRAAARGVVPSTTTDLQLAGVTAIAGTVHGPTGAPALYTVTLAGPTPASRGFAAPDGSFELDRIDPGDYKVSAASSDGNAEAKVHVDAGQTARVDLTLSANAVVIGKVVDKHGAPVAGVPVAVVPDSGNGSVRLTLEGPPPTTAPDGTFRLEAKPGPTNLIVLTQPVVTKRGLALQAGQTLDVGAVALQ